MEKCCHSLHFPGQECYFESTMIEYGGAAYMHVAVHRASTTLTASQSVDAKNEIQYIDFHAVYEDETQVVYSTLDNIS